LAAVAVMTLVAFRRVFHASRSVARGTEADARALLLAFSVTVPLMLLPVYHRTYDAIVVLFPVAWCLANLGGRWCRSAAVGLVASLALLVPVGLPSSLVRLALVGPGVAQAWWWDALVVPSRVWALLILFASLLPPLFASAEPGDDRPVPNAPPASPRESRG
ncbi:MAG TPA: hypothetical protein VK324_08850, partial [Tepidisphaeraceae bacterium]|nr:hypothetical protein [Tepidisphaeraceae bacterium]